MKAIELIRQPRIFIRQYFSFSGSILSRLHIDKPLLIGLFLLTIFGLIILYSAEGQNLKPIGQQILRLLLAFILLIGIAQVSPQKYLNWAPWLYILSILLLALVAVVGDVGKGAQRWLDLGILRFQPSEISKLIIPMMLAWYLQQHPLPPNYKEVAVCVLIIAFPTFLTAVQPDLGTAIILLAAGASVLFLAGLSWRFILSAVGLLLGSLPVLWLFLHEYQRERILTFFDPERDPLGTGYHIIQSKIAIGSGGLFGKGWLNGSQAYLNYLPEHSTDFIFAVCGEEFGLWGAILLLGLYGFLIGRGIMISLSAQDTFSRLVAGSISITFFLSVFINIGMVAGILPVVGLPLPLISYGGTAMVINLLNFGILMSIQTHRRLVGN